MWRARRPAAIPVLILLLAVPPGPLPAGEETDPPGDDRHLNYLTERLSSHPLKISDGCDSVAGFQRVPIFRV
jgi:hypothetical protein